MLYTCGHYALITCVVSNVSDLGKGIIKTSGREYTILLVGKRLHLL